MAATAEATAEMSMRSATAAIPATANDDTTSGEEPFVVVGLSEQTGLRRRRVQSTSGNRSSTTAGSTRPVRRRRADEREIGDAERNDEDDSDRQRVPHNNPFLVEDVLDLDLADTTTSDIRDPRPRRRRQQQQENELYEDEDDNDNENFGIAGAAEDVDHRLSSSLWAPEQRRRRWDRVDVLDLDDGILGGNDDGDDDDDDDVVLQQRGATGRVASTTTTRGATHRSPFAGSTTSNRNTSSYTLNASRVYCLLSTLGAILAIVTTQQQQPPTALSTGTATTGNTGLSMSGKATHGSSSSSSFLSSTSTTFGSAYIDNPDGTGTAEPLRLQPQPSFLLPPSHNQLPRFMPPTQTNTNYMKNSAAESSNAKHRDGRDGDGGNIPSTTNKWFQDWLHSVFGNHNKEEEVADIIIEEEEEEKGGFQLPHWLRWMIPDDGDSKKGRKHHGVDHRRSVLGKKDTLQPAWPNGYLAERFSNILLHPYQGMDRVHAWMVRVVDPTLIKPTATTLTDLIDKILTSTPRLLAIANLLLACTYLLHAAVADWFLGNRGVTAGVATAAAAAATTATATTTTTTAAGIGNGNNNPITGPDLTAMGTTPAPNAGGVGTATTTSGGRERLGGFLVFKLLLISAVLAPDTLDLLILLSWYTLLSFLRSLAHLCATHTQYTRQIGQTPRKGVLQLLFAVLVSDMLAAIFCIALFHGAGYGMVLLLTCDCLLLAIDVICHLLLYVQQVSEIQHHTQITNIENEQFALHQRLIQFQTQSEEDHVEHQHAPEVDQPEQQHDRVDISAETSAAAITDPTSAETQGDRSESDSAPPTESAGQDHGTGYSNTDNPSDGQHEFSRGEASTENTSQTNLEEIQGRLQQLDRQMARLEQNHSRTLAILDSSVFALQLLTHVLTVVHFVHIWSLHGVQFTLIDGVLALHLHSAISAASKKITERRNMYRIIRDIDSMFVNATDFELKKANSSGDVCCICLSGMNTVGTVKKVYCGHLYHTNCLREVIERARSIEHTRCPLCRASVVTGRQPDSRSNSNAHNQNGARQVGAQNAENVAGAVNPDNVVEANVTGTDNPRRVTTTNNPVAPAVAARAPGEQALFRFSSDELFPSWIPLPAFSFEVIRRPAVQPPLGVDWPPLGQDEQPQLRNNIAELAQDEQQRVEQPSFLHRLLMLFGIAPMSPEEEAAILEQLVDMFPQYDRSDLQRELRNRGSAEGVAEAILMGSFSGIPRGVGTFADRNDTAAATVGVLQN